MPHLQSKRRNIQAALEKDVAELKRLGYDAELRLGAAGELAAAAEDPSSRRT